MISLLLVEVLDGIAQGGPGHGRGMRIEEAQEPLAIVPSGLSKRPAGSLVDQVLVVVQQELGDPERVVHLAATDEAIVLRIAVRRSQMFDERARS